MGLHASLGYFQQGIQWVLYFPGMPITRAQAWVLEMQSISDDAHNGTLVPLGPISAVL